MLTVLNDKTNLTLTEDQWEAEYGALTDILRDVFGNPFRPVTFDPVWLMWNDKAVAKLAREIYEERAFDRMPDLGDALEKAGCTHSAILAHCRGTDNHVRGCWVVDVLNGKA